MLRKKETAGFGSFSFLTLNDNQTKSWSIGHLTPSLDLMTSCFPHPHPNKPDSKNNAIAMRTLFFVQATAKLDGKVDVKRIQAPEPRRFKNLHPFRFADDLLSSSSFVSYHLAGRKQLLESTILANLTKQSTTHNQHAHWRTVREKNFRSLESLWHTKQICGQLQERRHSGSNYTDNCPRTVTFGSITERFDKVLPAEHQRTTHWTRFICCSFYLVCHPNQASLLVLLGQDKCRAQN